MADQIQTDPQAQRFLDYPYAAGSIGAPKTANPDDHLRDLILQVLFTNPLASRLMQFYCIYHPRI